MTAMIIGFFSVDLADGEELELGRFLLQLLEIGLDLVVVRELSVRADLKSQKRLGRGLGGEKGGQEENEAKGE